MRLLKPLPGELVDRQTILELKIAHVESQKDFDNEDVQVPHGGITRTVVSNPTKVNVHPFVDELELVRKCLMDNWIPTIALDEEKVALYDKYFDELKAINDKLWDLQAELRVLRDAPDNHVDAARIRAGGVAFDIDFLNEQRANLVKSINQIWGYDTQEKLY